MINSKKPFEKARKGQKMVTEGRRRNSFSGTDAAADSSGCCTSLADKGHFVVYSSDGKRFVIPLAHLGSPIFIELLKMSEDGIGLPCSGPTKLPCTAVFLDYIISLIERHMCEDVEKALIAFITTSRCSRPFLSYDGLSNKERLLHGF